MYLFLNDSDQIMYAGMAHDLEAVLYRYKGLAGRQAMRERLAAGLFGRVIWLSCSVALAVPTVERLMIHRFSPPWNGQHNLSPRAELDAVVFDAAAKSWLLEAADRVSDLVRELMS